MGCKSLGWVRQGPDGGPPSICALVIYIPDPLGSFLDGLRRDLVPEYNPHAHVSVLPPRPLNVDWRAVSESARSVMEAWEPFDIELTTVGLFPGTDVVYVEVGQGAADLRKLHAVMNTGELAFNEPFLYHPHITLAQDLPPEGVAPAHERAIRRWSEFPGSRIFRAERTVFVQNTVDDCWVDLAEYPLGRNVPTHAKF